MSDGVLERCSHFIDHHGELDYSLGVGGGYARNVRGSLKEWGVKTPCTPQYNVCYQLKNTSSKVEKAMALMLKCLIESSLT